jgi:hypothetical protein
MFVRFPSFFHVARPPFGHNQLVSIWRAKPASTSGFVRVEEDQAKFLQSFHVDFGFIDRDFQGARDFINVQPLAARWTPQPLENLNLNLWYVLAPLLLFLLFPFCPKRIDFHIKRLQLALKLANLRARFFKSRLQTRYLRFRVAYSRAILQGLREAKTLDKFALNVAKGRLWFLPDPIYERCNAFRQALTLLFGHRGCESQPNLKQ